MLDFEQLKTLTRIVEAAITAGIGYASVARDDGSKLLNDFVDVSGVFQPVDFQPVSNGRGTVYQSVTLVMTNLTITNNPSTGI